MVSVRRAVVTYPVVSWGAVGALPSVATCLRLPGCRWKRSADTLVSYSTHITASATAVQSIGALVAA